MVAGAIAAVGGMAFQSAFMMPAVQNQLQYWSYEALPNENYPIEQMPELRRRGIIGHDNYFDSMKNAGLNESKARDLFYEDLELEDIGSLIDLRYRGEISQGEFETRMFEVGVEEEAIDNLYESAKRLLDGGDILRLKWRNEIDQDEYYERMKDIHMSETDADYFEESNRYLPSANDVITFAVREAFYPDYREEYGLDEEYPEELTEWAAKQGMSKDIAKLFWWSHWDLPSMRQGFEMFQRGVIDEEDLDNLFMAADILPWWRDRLRQIAYRVPTRVDTRRMIRDGIIPLYTSTDEMPEGPDDLDLEREREERTGIGNYLRMGYDPEDAVPVAKLSQTMYKDEERDLTRTMIIDGYMKNQISEEDALSFLQEIGYSEEDAEFLVNQEVLEAKEDRLDELIDIQTSRFVQGMIEESTLLDQLNQLDLPGDYIAEKINEARIEREKKADYPSKTDVKKFLASEIISNKEAKNYLSNIGYRKEDIKNYLALWTEEKKSQLEEIWGG